MAGKISGAAGKLPNLGGSVPGNPWADPNKIESQKKVVEAQMLDKKFRAKSKSTGLKP